MLPRCIIRPDKVFTIDEQVVHPQTLNHSLRHKSVRMRHFCCRKRRYWAYDPLDRRS